MNVMGFGRYRYWDFRLGCLETTCSRRGGSHSLDKKGIQLKKQGSGSNLQFLIINDLLISLHDLFKFKDRNIDFKLCVVGERKRYFEKKFDWTVSKAI